MAQKRGLVAKKIQALRHEARNKAQSLLGEGCEQAYDRSLTFDHLDTLEILLLLLWRHLQYYTESRPSGSQIQASTAHIARLVTSMDAESFRADVPRKLSTLLQRLDALDVVIAIHITKKLTLTRIHLDRIRNRWQKMEIGGSIVRISKRSANGLGRRRVFVSLNTMGKA